MCSSWPSTLTRRFAPPSPNGRGIRLNIAPLPLGEGGAKRRVRVEAIEPSIPHSAPVPFCFSLRQISRDCFCNPPVAASACYLRGQEPAQQKCLHSSRRTFQRP